MKTIRWIFALTLLFALTPAWAEQLSMKVYKSPTCGCCSDWIKHLEENGIKVQYEDVNDVVPFKRHGGVTPELASCHTGFIKGYTIEGHVPAADIKRLLKEAPAAKGLAVPGMPMGSPGMEGHRQDRYDVVLFDRDGNQSVFASH